MMRGRGVSCAGKWLLAKIVFSDFNHNECHKGIINDHSYLWWEDVWHIIGRCWHLTIWTLGQICAARYWCGHTKCSIDATKWAGLANRSPLLQTLLILSFEDAFKKTQWRKAKLMQPPSGPVLLWYANAANTAMAAHFSAVYREL